MGLRDQGTHLLPTWTSGSLVMSAGLPVRGGPGVGVALERLQLLRSSRPPGGRGGQCARCRGPQGLGLCRPGNPGPSPVGWGARSSHLPPSRSSVWSAPPRSSMRLRAGWKPVAARCAQESLQLPSQQRLQTRQGRAGQQVRRTQRAGLHTPPAGPGDAVLGTCPVTHLGFPGWRSPPWPQASLGPLWAACVLPEGLVQAL